MKNIKQLRTIVLANLLVLALLAIVAVAFGSLTPKAGAQSVNGNFEIPTATYTLDVNHSVIGFGIKHLGIAMVEGRFKDFKGTINYNGKDVSSSSVDFTAKIDSIDTGVTPRDNHLRTADFFDVAKYPEMTFRSSRIEKKGKEWVMTGDLTIKGVTKTVSLPFSFTGAIKDPWGGTRFGINASTRINRRDFGINYGNTLPGGILDVANDVEIRLHLEAVQAKAEAAK